MSICRKYDVTAVVSLIDPELSLLARARDRFLQIGTIPIVSDHEGVEMCFNKYSMYTFLKENGFRTARSYIDEETFYRDVELGEIRFPVFVKPVKGSASQDINKATSREEVELLFKRHDGLMIQEFMDGVEYGADVYVDMLSGEPVAIFTKEKIKMRAGETDKSVSMKDERLFELLFSFVKKAGLRGIVDIDLFKVNGEYYISEVNPRFGGGYPHAHECGVNIAKMIINNLMGVVNPNVIGNYEEGVYMIKYSEVKVLTRDKSVIGCFLKG